MYFLKYCFKNSRKNIQQYETSEIEYSFLDMSGLIRYFSTAFLFFFYLFRAMAEEKKIRWKLFKIRRL